MTVNYDSENDVLYLGFEDRNNSRGDEILSGVIVLRDMDTKEMTGLTILDFEQRCDELKEALNKWRLSELTAVGDQAVQ